MLTKQPGGTNKLRQCGPAPASTAADQAANSASRTQATSRYACSAPPQQLCLPTWLASALTCLCSRASSEIVSCSRVSRSRSLAGVAGRGVLVKRGGIRAKQVGGSQHHRTAQQRQLQHALCTRCGPGSGLPPAALPYPQSPPAGWPSSADGGPCRAAGPASVSRWVGRAGR